MKGKIVKKIIMITLVCMLMLLDVFIISKQIVQAEELAEQEKTEITIAQEIEKYFEVEENQVLLQQAISVKLSKEDKVKTSESLTVDIPMINEYAPNSAIVLLNGTKLPDNTYFYDAQNKKLDININAESQLKEFNNDQNTYKIIYTYLDMPIQEKITTKLNTSVRVNIDAEGEISATNEQEVETEIKGSDISVSGAMAKEVSKGYLYQGAQFSTAYAEANRIDISSISNLEGITISNVSEKFIEEDKAINPETNQEETIEKENDVNQSIYYTLTRVNKDEMLNILGNDGKITIYNVNDEILTEFNKDTETDEAGNIIYRYNGEDTTAIKIVTTKPIQEGRIDFYHEKAIKANTGYAREDIQRFDYVRETIQANNETAVMNLHLIEPSTQFDVTLNKTEYSTMNTNKDIDISIILKNNQNDMCLYENPEIEIVFPQEVQNLEIQDQVNILYDSELSIKDAYVEGNVIHIVLNGIQTNYKEVGTQINLKVSMSFDKKLTNRNSEIITRINNKEEIVEDKKEVSIVSPREMITVNNIQEFGVESYGEEKQLTAEIEKNSDAKTMQVESEIINNTDNTTSVKVLGEFPTDGDKNNLGSTVNTPVQVEGVNATVYYTANENATEDIDNRENGWVNDSNAVNDAKKYLIAIDEMTPDNSARFTYSASIPANLEYNQKATEGYTVYYTDEQSNISNKAEATDVVMTTGDGPIVEAELVAKVNGEAVNTGDTVKAGEKISYEIALTNTGTEEANNIAVDLTIAQSNNTGNDEVINLSVENIQPDETKTVSYEKEVATDLSSDISITANAKITYNEEQKDTNEITVNAKPSAIVGEVWWNTNETTQLLQGDSVVYSATITNNTDEKQSDLVLQWELPENCEIEIQQMVTYVENEDPEVDYPSKEYEDLGTNNPITLRTLEPRETIRIDLTVYIGEFSEKTQTAFASATVTQGEEFYRIGKTTEREVYNTSKFYTIGFSANDEGDYLKAGDEINYTATVTSENMIQSVVTIEDSVPTQLTILEVTVEGLEDPNITITANDITISNLMMQPNETKTIHIKAVVDQIEDLTEDESIINQFTLIDTRGYEATSNQVQHLIDRQSSNPEDPDEPINPEDPDNPNNPEDPNNPENPNQPSDTYKISGTVWLDDSLEGRRDENEIGVSGINVYALNAETNQVIDVSASTNAEGFYTLSDIPNGRYIVVFDYSSTQYGLTKYQVEGIEENRNSKALARQINIFGNEKTYGVTDMITIDGASIGNINMGLIELEDFDLKIDKFISRVTVESQKETSVYGYNEVNLAKVELNAKKLNNSKVTVEYTIRVTNVGQIEGYARRIVDYIPEGFTFDASQNKDWYTSGDQLYSVILANEKISAGDSKTITLTLTKDMSNDTTGTYTNRVALEESYNEMNVADNNARNGNDTSSAELIISVGTGTVILYIALTISIIAIIGVGVYFIKIKVLGVKK